MDKETWDTMFTNVSISLATNTIWIWMFQSTRSSALITLWVKTLQLSINFTSYMFLIVIFETSCMKYLCQKWYKCFVQVILVPQSYENMRWMLRSPGMKTKSISRPMIGQLPHFYISWFLICWKWLCPHLRLRNDTDMWETVLPRILFK